MRDVLCIYYSRTGNTKRVMETIAKEMDAELLALTDGVERSGLRGWLRSGMDAMRKDCPDVLPFETERKLENYRLVIVGTPVWAGRCSSVIRSFLKNHGGEMKRVAYVLTRGSEHKSEDIYRQMDQYTGKPHQAATSLRVGHVGHTFCNQQPIIGVGESNALVRKLSMKSSQGGYKVCIIWLPERMNGECANSMLKLIEEPPHQTVFIMVCEEPEKLLETIRSRTQRFDFKRIDTPSMEQTLIDKRYVAPDMAHRIARVANGNWLAAEAELDAGNENRLFLDMFIMLMRLAYMRKIKDLKKWSEAVAGYGRERQKSMLAYFGRLIRENFMYNFQNPELNYMTAEEENFSKNFARFINEANVVELSELYERGIRDIGQNANAKIVFFDIALKTIVLLIQK